MTEAFILMKEGKVTWHSLARVKHKHRHYPE